MKEALQTAYSDMKYFFDPSSIAIIGASNDFTKPSGRPVEALLKRGYKGKIYPVNPRYTEIAGLKCYPSVLDIPGEVHLAIISIPAGMVLEALAQCAKKEIKAVIIFSSGFAEVGTEGKLLQQQITDLARSNGMLLCGPNCFGLINLNNSVMASFAHIVDLEPVSPKSLGFVTQSGAFGAMIYTQALKEGVGFSSFISVGNEADLEFSDFIAYLLDDPETKVIGGYLEGAKDGKKLRQVAERALQLQKPILIMKVGRSKAGSRAASSHTGSLAGDDTIYSSFFKQLGIIRIESLQELTAFVTAFRSGHRPKGKNVAILSGSGGAGVVIADKCESLGLAVPEIRGETRAKLEGYLPFFASAQNPIDLTAQVATDPQLVGKCLRAILADDNIDSVILNIGFSDEAGPLVTKDIMEAYRSTSKPLLVISTFLGNSPVAKKLAKQMRSEGIPLILDSLQAVQALAYLVEYQNKVAQQEPSELREYNPENGVKELLKGPGQLMEYECKQVLAKYDISITREGLAVSAEEAVELANQISYPVALKIQSPELLHKTESGGIKLHLNSAGEVRQAYDAIIGSARKFNPDADIKGVLVQEFVPEGVEVIIGTTKDPVFGPVVMFGLGGIFVEALKDVTFRIAPLSRQDAMDMIREIKGYPVLQGMRGKPPADLDALVDVILKVSRLITECKDDIAELDINPLKVFAKGAKVVDALIVK